MKWDIDYQWNTFDTFYAVDSFANYWSENETLIRQAADKEEERYGPKWTPDDEDEVGEYHMERSTVRHLHDEIMTPIFRYSCAVMLYTIVERELRRLIQNLEHERGQQKLRVNDIREGSFLAQAAKFIDVFFGVRLTASQHYQALCDLQKIRDCIIHCRGEVNLSRDKAYLLNLQARRPGFFAWDGADIEIRPECLEQFINEVWAFFTWVFHELKWNIDEAWKNNKWRQRR